jgi:WD40 repeat protein
LFINLEIFLQKYCLDELIGVVCDSVLEFCDKQTPTCIYQSLQKFYSLQVWDLRKNDILYTMPGHTDTVTGFKLSPDGSFLLSNAMDNTGM